MFFYNKPKIQESKTDRQRGSDEPKTSNWKMSKEMKYTKPIEPMWACTMYILLIWCVCVVCSVCTSPNNKTNKTTMVDVLYEKKNTYIYVCIIIWNRKYLNFRFTHIEREESGIGSRLPLLCCYLLLHHNETEHAYKYHAYTI